MKYNVLSIDAWGNDDFCWEWNSWSIVGKYYESEYRQLTDETAMHYFADKLGVSASELESSYYIYDDQYNLVLANKDSHEPLYAICYGEIEQ